MNYRNILQKGTEVLKKKNITTANIDAEILLSISVNKSREKILLNPDEHLSNKEIKQYIHLIKRRKKKEPISHICKKRFFWKYDFKVNKSVLTPRFETEHLVEEILKKSKYLNNINVLDVGLGSGCILISLLKEKKNWKGIGLDISKSAVKTAKNNAKIQQVYNRIKFINSDIDKFCHGKYDIIVSNPPYINNIGYNNLDISVKGYEPKTALCGGLDGLKIIEKLILKSKLILKKNGLLAMEIGIGQHSKVTNILKKNGFFILKIVKDFQNIKRCILAKRIK